MYDEDHRRGTLMHKITYHITIVGCIALSIQAERLPSTHIKPPELITIEQDYLQIAKAGDAAIAAARSANLQSQDFLAAFQRAQFCTERLSIALAQWMKAIENGVVPMTSTFNAANHALVFFQKKVDALAIAHQNDIAALMATRPKVFYDAYDRPVVRTTGGYYAPAPAVYF